MIKCNKAAQCAIYAMAIWIAFGTSGQAQHIPTGKRIAEKWCGNCHAIEAAGHAPATDGAPTFASIANMNSTTAMSLAVFLSTPHANMPNYTLSRQEIADIAAYILSLRSKR